MWEGPKGTYYCFSSFYLTKLLTTTKTTTNLPNRVYCMPGTVLRLPHSNNPYSYPTEVGPHVRTQAQKGQGTLSKVTQLFQEVAEPGLETKTVRTKDR